MFAKKVVTAFESSSHHDVKKTEQTVVSGPKTSVKGLLDAGLSKLPGIFIHEHQKSDEPSNLDMTKNIPMIDLGGKVSTTNDKDHKISDKVIEEIKNVCENWGFFQAIIHGIPTNVLQEMISRICRFNEEAEEEKETLFSRDVTRKVTFSDKVDAQGGRAYWRDTLTCVMSPNPPLPEELPSTCRDITIEYSKYVMSLGITLFELISGALGLDPNHLRNMGCTEGLHIMGHYYPSCPEPERTMGIGVHTDGGFLTVLLQDHIGDLQVLHDGRWVHVEPIPGALIINLGDFLQLISNDKFISVYHRVIAKRTGPRISVASFFRTCIKKENSLRMYGPIKELLSEDNPPKYRDIDTVDYFQFKHANGVEGTRALSHFTL